MLTWVVPVVLVIAAGCVTEFNPATQRQETLLYSDEKEKSLGASVALQVEKKFTFNMEVDINERVERILNKIEEVSDRKDLVFTVRVIEDDEVNAFSLPGGYVYLFKGLIDIIDTDDQLAAVIGHEMAHVTAKHAMKRLQGAYGAMALEVAAMASGNVHMAAGVDLAASSLLFANSREDEFEADRLGVRYMRRAGYDPRQMKVMLGKLLAHQAKQPPRPLNYWRSHPFIPARMASADAEAKGKTEYRDYLNLTGED